MITTEDLTFIAQAIQLAYRGEGCVEPNPMVGCLLVRDGQVISSGYHQRFGGPHAEREALAQLPTGGAEGATAYVTLEPCCHHGKTPPCTDALIAARVKRVCCAMLDPFPLVSGKGIEQLRQAGIEVDVLSAGQSPASSLMAPYLKRVTQGLPYVIGKWAMSLDGKMATRTGDSRWISGPESRAHAHRTRGRMDAIIVGSRTAQLDDPMLTARPAGPRTAVRVVVDSLASLPVTSKLAQSTAEAPVLVWASDAAPESHVERLIGAGCRVERCIGENRLKDLLSYLTREYQATNVLCEGGGQLLGGLVDQQLIDEYHVYIAPKVIGGAGATVPCLGLGFEAVSQGPKLEVVQRTQLGEDQFLRLRVLS